jgi:hypothetical protein
MPKTTKSQAHQMAEELITLKPIVDRYRQLEAELKGAFKALMLEEIETRQGRVFASVVERMTVPPSAVRHVLGDALASKIIQQKESVPNKLLATFFEVGDITDGQMNDLRNQAKKRAVISLHIRPLN